MHVSVCINTVVHAGVDFLAIVNISGTLLNTQYTIVTTSGILLNTPFSDERNWYNIM